MLLTYADVCWRARQVPQGESNAGSWYAWNLLTAESRWTLEDELLTADAAGTPVGEDEGRSADSGGKGCHALEEEWGLASVLGGERVMVTWAPASCAPAACSHESSCDRPSATEAASNLAGKTGGGGGHTKRQEVAKKKKRAANKKFASMLTYADVC